MELTSAHLKLSVIGPRFERKRLLVWGSELFSPQEHFRRGISQRFFQFRLLNFQSVISLYPHAHSTLVSSTAAFSLLLLLAGRTLFAVPELPLLHVPQSAEVGGSDASRLLNGTNRKVIVSSKTLSTQLQPLTSARAAAAGARFDPAASTYLASGAGLSIVSHSSPIFRTSRVIARLLQP